MKNAKKRNFVIATIAVVAVIVLLLMLRSCAGIEQGAEETPPFEISDAISDDGPAQRSQSEIVSELNRIVEEGQITMTINPDPFFASGEAKGNLLIHNDDTNRHAEIIQIVRDDTQETIYTSGMIPVGKYVNSDTLDVALPAGSYPCTAFFHLVNEDGGQMLGTGAVRITVHIES